MQATLSVRSLWSRQTPGDAREMTMPTERYEILILGSGFGGKLLAWDMAGAGHRTAVVERRWIGGSCPNINCLPSKNEIWSAKVADLLRHAADFGLVTARTRPTCRAYGSGSATWSKPRSPRTWRTTRRAVPN